MRKTYNPVNVGPTQKESYRNKALEIARTVGAQWVAQEKMENGDWLLKFCRAGKGGLVLVQIGPDYCFHFVQGGGMWAQLEEDLMPEGRREV